MNLATPKPRSEFHVCALNGDDSNVGILAEGSFVKNTLPATSSPEAAGENVRPATDTKDFSTLLHEALGETGRSKSVDQRVLLACGHQGGPASAAIIKWSAKPA